MGNVYFKGNFLYTEPFCVIWYEEPKLFLWDEHLAYNYWQDFKFLWKQLNKFVYHETRNLCIHTIYSIYYEMSKVYNM